MPNRRILSASQIGTYALCQRKWGLKYLNKLPDPTGAGAAFGKKVHAVLEDWLRDGKAPDLKTRHGKIAASSLQDLPTPQPNLFVERYFKFNTEHHAYRGYVDLGYVDAEQRPVIIDHKTTSGLQWALDQETLFTDVQAVLYAYEAMETFDAEEALLQWNYMPTRGKVQCKPVQITMTRAQAREGFAHVEEVAAHLYTAEARANGNGFALETNPEACGSFGGCPYRDDCKLTGRDQLFAFMKQEKTKVDLLSKLKNKKNDNPQPTEALPDPAEPANAPPQINPPEAPTGAAATEPEPTSAAEAQEPAPKRGRGRPKGSKNKSTSTAEDAQGTDCVPSSPMPMGQRTLHATVGATKWDFAITAMTVGGCTPEEVSKLLKGHS